MNPRIEQALATLKEIEDAVKRDVWSDGRNVQGRIVNAVSIYCAQLEREVMEDAGHKPVPNASVGAASTENTRPIARRCGSVLEICGVDVLSSMPLTVDNLCAAINAAYQKRRAEEK
jgi:hypothetical protein